MDERVTALEGEMAEMRQEWEVVRRTPAAQTRLLNAMRMTQLEHGRDIAELKGDVAVLKGDVAVLKKDVGELKQGMGTIVGMLTTLIERDTGPR